MSPSNLTNLAILFFTNLIFLQDPLAEVRQSAFALLGDLSKTCPALVLPNVAQLMPLISTNLDPGYVSVCNNAAWAAGEIAVKLGEEMQVFIPALVNPLVPPPTIAPPLRKPRCFYLVEVVNGTAFDFD